MRELLSLFSNMDSAVALSARLLGLSAFVQTAEYLAMAKLWRREGVWDWNIVKEDFNYGPWPLRRAFDFFFDDAGFLTLLILRLLAAIALVAAGAIPMCLMVIAASTLLIVWRFRGTFNGGSDSITFLHALCLWGIQGFGVKYAAIFYFYLSVQAMLSYFVAGIVKVREQTWWTGEALVGFLSAQRYAVPPSVSHFFGGHLTLSRLASGVVIFYELTFPLAFLNARILLGYLFLGILFHLANYFVLGLNRFFFSWTATYPVLFAVGLKLTAN